jgi:hypothetical protein
MRRTKFPPNTKLPDQVSEEVPYRFKVSGNLIKKLGQESIANKNVAILELIKNSYDANASKVVVHLEDVQSKDAVISIEDNGEGMTATDLENKWLNIATPNKGQGKPKKGSRIQVGEKGLGRLSSESLGSTTVLETKPRKETTGYKIVFDWTKYEDPGVLLNEIVNIGHKTRKKRMESGTTLAISKLRHDWNDLDAQKNLLRDIYLLHPLNGKPKNFTISTTGFSIKKTLKKPTRGFLALAAYSVKVNLVAGSVLKFRISCISGKTRKGQLKLASKLYCGDAAFEMYYFYRTPNAIKTALGVEIGAHKIREANVILDDYSGIKIYRDGFRIKPYGEIGNDWLGLDFSFQNDSMYPRNNNVFGFAHISKVKNPNIKDTTTREGIVHNSEFQDLTRFIKTAIQEIFLDFRKEVESHKVKAKRKKARAQSKKKAVASVPEVSPPKAPDKLLKNLGGNYPQSFYSQLEQEINDCFEKNFPNAAFFLSRKLIENLIFNILERQYPKKVDLWYNQTAGSHHKLSLLIKNLYDNRNDFKPNVKAYVEKFNTDIGQFRREANAKAHNIFEYLKDKAELKKFHINDLTQLLLNIYNLQ